MPPRPSSAQRSGRGRCAADRRRRGSLRPPRARRARRALAAPALEEVRRPARRLRGARDRGRELGVAAVERREPRVALGGGQVDELLEDVRAPRPEAARPRHAPALRSATGSLVEERAGRPPVALHRAVRDLERLARSPRPRARRRTATRRCARAPGRPRSSRDERLVQRERSRPRAPSTATSTPVERTGAARPPRFAARPVAARGRPGPAASRARRARRSGRGPAPTSAPRARELQVGLVHERRRRERRPEARPELAARDLPELVVDEREEAVGRRRVALLHGGQKPRDLARGDVPNPGRHGTDSSREGAAGRLRRRAAPCPRRASAARRARDRRILRGRKAGGSSAPRVRPAPFRGRFRAPAPAATE